MRRAWMLAAVLACAVCAGCIVSFDESLLADGGPDAAPCNEPLACDGDQLRGCGRTIEDCHLGCSTDPSPRCRRLVPINGLPSPAGGQSAVLDLSQDALLDACTGMVDGAAVAGSAFSNKTQIAGPTIGVLQLRRFHLRQGVVLSVYGGCALAIVADGEVEVAGTVDLRGGLNSPYMPGPGGLQGGFVAPAAGCGAGGAGQAGLGGGGGGGHAAQGGGGGLGGQGGAVCGDDSQLAGGSGGGSGTCAKAPCEAGHGGGGGGALVLVSGERIRVKAGAGINAGGGGGEGGKVGQVGGGGGGAGGVVVLEAPEHDLDPTAILALGGGGGGALGTGNASDARGASGLLGVEAAPGGAGKADGGVGSSAAVSAGSPGAGDQNGGGGGGGAAGRVRINSSAGSVALPKIHGSISQAKVGVK